MRAMILAVLVLMAAPTLAQDAERRSDGANPLDLPAEPVGFCRACEIQNCGCDAERGMCVDCGNLEDGEGVVDALSRAATQNACLQRGGTVTGEACRF